jgi:hypothetical protein
MLLFVEEMSAFKCSMLEAVAASLQPFHAASKKAEGLLLASSAIPFAAS